VIWVFGRDKKFYSHVGKIGRIHHSSFFGGNAILCGGDWTVEKGELKTISGRTGRYRTSVDHFAAALLTLEKENILKPDEKVIHVWNVGWLAKNNPTDGSPVAVSWNEFRQGHDTYQLFPP
jgi:hypothetical protein